MLVCQLHPRGMHDFLCGWLVYVGELPLSELPVEVPGSSTGDGSVASAARLVGSPSGGTFGIKNVVGWTRELSPISFSQSASIVISPSREMIVEASYLPQVVRFHWKFHNNATLGHRFLVSQACYCHFLRFRISGLENWPLDKKSGYREKGVGNRGRTRAADT